jgi:hypothetical protein
VIVDDVPAETIRWLQAHGIIVERMARSGQPRMAATLNRFFCYLDFVIRHVDVYTHVMLADPHSTILQLNPFSRDLPAEIVYATERRLIEGSSEDRGAVAQAYGEAVADNIRDCTVSCGDVVLGTGRGMLHYLLAMTTELTSRTIPLTSGTERGIHNYVVSMRPLRNAWLDPSGWLVSDLRSVPDSSIAISDHGVLIDGRLTPVLHRWEQQEAVRDYIGAAPQFRDPLPAASRATAAPVADVEPRAAERMDAVVAFYHRERDAGWLTLFLDSLRCAGHTGSVHCVGEFNEREQRLLSQYGCVAHQMAPTDAAIVENVAHFHLSQTLDSMAADFSVRYDQVLVLETMRVVFVRDPFLAKTIGLSVFTEGPTRIGDSDYNNQRLVQFGAIDESWLSRPVVSSCLMRGRLDIVRVFYRKLFIEFVGRAELLRIPKVVQGAVNKLCHGGGLEFPIIQHPNAAEVFFEFTPSPLGVNTRNGIRIGGAVPAIVLNLFGVSELILSVAASLGLDPPGALVE